MVLYLCTYITCFVQALCTEHEACTDCACGILSAKTIIIRWTKVPSYFPEKIPILTLTISENMANYTFQVRASTDFQSD